MLNEGRQSALSRKINKNRCFSLPFITWIRWSRPYPPPPTHTSPSSSPEFNVASWWSHLVLTCLATKSKSKKRVTHFRLVRPNYTHTHTYGIYLTHTHTHCQADILVQTYTQHSQAADRIFIINKCWWLEKWDYSKANIFVHLITAYMCIVCLSVVCVPVVRERVSRLLS